MNTIRTRTAVAAAAVLASTLIATPAMASASKCLERPTASCVEVNGTNLHVNWIRSKVGLAAKTCRYGHSQVLINGYHFSDSNFGRDKTYCSTSIFGSRVTTGSWTVNRSYTKGTKICSKFWWNNGKTGPGTVNGYTDMGLVCATIG
ncbi:hypothetical protein ACQPZJ_44520 [Actinoplanes sp. CA-054009]